MRVPFFQIKGRSINDATDFGRHNMHNHLYISNEDNNNNGISIRKWRPNKWLLLYDKFNNDLFNLKLRCTWHEYLWLSVLFYKVSHVEKLFIIIVIIETIYNYVKKKKK